MFREFFLDRTVTDRLVAWVGLLLVIGQAIYSSVIKFQINEWYNDFYNLLQTSGKHLMANATAYVFCCRTWQGSWRRCAKCWQR